VRGISVGHHVIPLWLVATLLLSGVLGTAIASYIWTSIVIDLEVEEPLKILHYPKKLRLYPGETEEFNVTVKNSASRNYTVVLDFSLENQTYQDDYVRFSDETYTIKSGEQNVTAWLRVEEHAPPIETSLTVSFTREPYPFGLVGYWKFDEGSGTTACDNSGNDNTGTLVNGPSWVEGKSGKALRFDGENDYVDCGTLGNLGSTRLGGATTYMCWLNSSQTASSFILGTANDYPEMAMSVHTNTPEVDKVRVYLRDDNWVRLAADLADPFDFTGTGWHHFAFVLDAEHAELAFYIDGIPRDVVYYYKESPSSFSDFQYPLFVGAHDMWGSIEYEPPMQPLPKVTFEGVLDEVMIFNRALTEEEIAGHYGGPTEILFFDDFDDGIADGWSPQRGNAWEVIDGEYFSSLGGGRGISVVDNLTFSDGAIKATIWHRDTEVAFQDGIVFRYSDDEHYYSFFVSDEYDEVRLRRHDPSDPHYGVPIIDWAKYPTNHQGAKVGVEYPIHSNTIYTLEVRIFENTFTGFVNGEKILNGTDTAFDVGSVGLSAHRGDVYFDDFTVYSLP